MSKKPTSDEQFGSVEDAEGGSFDIVSEHMGSDGYQIFDVDLEGIEDKEDG